jgi:hypothetical protein
VDIVAAHDTNVFLSRVSFESFSSSKINPTSYMWVRLRKSGQRSSVSSLIAHIRYLQLLILARIS